MRNTEVEMAKQSYTLTAKIFHWSFVIIFAYGISKQINNIEQLEDLALLKFEITFALLFILFLVARFVYMKRTQKSSLPHRYAYGAKSASKSSTLWHVYWDDIYSTFRPSHWMFILARP